MRPLEVLVSGVNVFTFLTLVMQVTVFASWFRYLAPVTLLIAAIQIIQEGIRWQMIPAYALTSFFCVIWLLGLLIPNGIQVHRFLLGAGFVIGTLGIFMSVLLPLALPVFSFPTPTEPYSIGTMTYHR